MTTLLLIIIIIILLAGITEEAGRSCLGALLLLVLFAVLVTISAIGVSP